MSSTTYEWQVVAMFDDMTESRSVPTVNRDFAMAVLINCKAAPQCIDAKLIKRTIVSEEESV